MNEEKIARINELSRKSKAEGLSDAEKQEQAALRAEYIAAIRANFKQTLDSIETDASIRSTIFDAADVIESLGLPTIIAEYIETVQRQMPSKKGDVSGTKTALQLEIK